jgi:NDP-sugar pyrophosphorylase family protein
VHVDFPQGVLGRAGILHYRYGGQWYPIGDVDDYETAFHDDEPGVHNYVFRITAKEKEEQKNGWFEAHDYRKKRDDRDIYGKRPNTRK